MAKYNEFYNTLNSSEKEYKCAPYWKRILSALIDAALVYLGYLTASFLTNFSPKREVIYLNLIMTLIVSVFVFYNSYIATGRTVGELFLKIKPIFIIDLDKKTKKMNYIKRAFIKCVIFLPMGLSKTTIIFAFILGAGTLICLFNPRLRKYKVMLWDYATTMIVVEND